MSLGEYWNSDFLTARQPTPKCGNCGAESSVRYQSRLDIANNRRPVRYFCFECYEAEGKIVKQLEDHEGKMRQIIESDIQEAERLLALTKTGFGVIQ